MFCENCGCKLNDDDLFCASCGKKVERVFEVETAPMAKPENTAEAEYIPMTETASYEETAFEEYRETAETMPVYEPAPSNPKTPKENKGLIITIAACGAVLLVLIGILLFFLLGSDEEEVYIPDMGAFTDIIDNDEIETEEEAEEEPEVIINEIDSNTVANIVASDSIYTRYGIYVKNLDNGYTFEYNADDIFNSSAMCQVVILDTLFKECEDHNININTAGMNFNYLENGKQAPGSENQNGQYFTIRQYAEAVAEYGDNNRSNQLVDYIASINGTNNGFDIINNTLRKNGHGKTLISRKIYTAKQQHLIDQSAPINRTTPAEIAEIFYDFIYNKSIDDPDYLKNICKSIDLNGAPIGFKEFVSPEYKVYNVNAFNTQSSNNVAIISNGKTDILVSILSETPEGTANASSGDKRDPIIDRLIDYIVQVQFQ